MFRLILFCSLLLLCSACHVGRFFWWNFADIKDNKKFAETKVANNPAAIFQFTALDSNNQGHKQLLELKLESKSKGKISLFEGLEQEHTVAFLVIRNDSILLEQYFDKYEQSSVVPSFSVAKSFTSALFGMAMDEGLISSVDDGIRNYLPELPAEPFDKITLRHLLEMRSGLEFNESYFNPFGHVAKFYYGLNLKKFSRKLKAAEAPDQNFNYISVNTQLLGLVVERVTNKSLSKYLEEKIWQPLGMEYPTSWSVDSKKHHTEKAFCCINAAARDFAKFGRLYLNKGNWNGQQLLSEAWIEESLAFQQASHYSYQWWRRPSTRPIFEGDFYANGFLGQYIYVNPKKNIIIVRLGKKSGDVYWPKFFHELAAML